MKIFFQSSKNMALLTTILFLWPNFCQPQSKSVTSKLSLIQQFQLDFINQELHQYPELFIKDWDTNNRTQFIIKTAELAVQTSPIKTRSIMKERIIDLFAQISIAIQFTDNNIIIKLTEKNSPKVKDRHPYRSLKKHHPSQKQDHSMDLPKLHKIHGARRTMNRLKKKRAEREKAAREKKPAELRRQAASKENEQERMKQRSKPYQPQEASEDEFLPLPT